MSIHEWFGVIKDDVLTNGPAQYQVYENNPYAYISPNFVLKRFGRAFCSKYWWGRGYCYDVNK